jgi:hypothetical protein
VYQFFYVECAAMRALWMFIKFFLLLIIGAVGAMFALENGQQLAVNFVLFQGPSLIMFYRRKLAHAAKKKD